MIEVLWIDDECMTDSNELSFLGQEFIESAYDKGIKITPVLTYKEGIDAIKTNPKRWCAVILDIHNQKAVIGQASDGFDEAKEEIARIQGQNDQQEPYVFVLSGNKQYKGDGCTIRCPQYASKAIYDKNNGDYEILFEDIRKIENVSELYQLQSQYSDVLISAREFCGEKTYIALMSLLFNIIKKGVRSEAALLNDMRKILEDVMEGCRQHGYPYFTDTNKEITLNNFSRYIGTDKAVPIYIQRAFHSLTEIVQNGSHRLSVDDDVSSMKAPYLLRSCLYELCNILMWMRDLA